MEARNKRTTNPSYVMLFGEKISIEIKSEMLKPIAFENDRFLINQRYIQYSNLLVKRWLKRYAENYLTKRTKELSFQTGLKFNKVLVKEVKTRWGSCSSKGTISLNWLLIMAPRKVIDYVIIHELAHTVHMNHSKKFWELVEKLFPEWKVCRYWLRKNGHTLNIK
ncbi:MAG: M48 family metallopeptidase [Fervidobacterium sp.]|jgi:predicted metal-dependent hydrolase